ncbi:MAG: hypothetical protein HOP28_14690 [Gemmatimonadales bacterium]|nr:hypothetical protein [Gemmatimonadales bacterium]
MNTIFEVAISFVDQFDRGMAERLFVDLAPRLTGDVFVYWRHQDLLAGKRQEDGFGPIFRSNSRVVVVLLRPEWGGKGGTLVEAQEIQRRHLTGDKDFLYFLATTTNARLPDWAPPSLVYYDLTKYPIGEAIEGIVEMHRRRTAAPKPALSALAKMRLQRQSKKERNEEQWFLESSEGRDIARQAARSLLDEIATYVESFNRDNPDFRLSFRMNRMRDQVLIAYDKNTAIVSWDDPISKGNTIPQIVYSECDGLRQLRYDEAVPDSPGNVHIAIALIPRIQDDGVAAWLLDESDPDDRYVPNWIEKGRPRVFTPQEFVEYLVERILARALAE